MSAHRTSRIASRHTPALARWWSPRQAQVPVLPDHAGYRGTRALDSDDKRFPPAKPWSRTKRSARCCSLIDAVNNELASYETLKKFEVLPEDFSVESGELTPSLKVKRRVIQKRYEELIDGFYGEKFV